MNVLDVLGFLFTIGFVGMFFIPLLMSIVPWLIAYCRGHHDQLGVFLVGWFGSYTVLGWVVAMVWAIGGETKMQRYINLQTEVTKITPAKFSITPENQKPQNS